MITVGTTGCGFAGSALKTWLEEDNKDVTVVVSDPPKGMDDDISGAYKVTCFNAVYDYCRRMGADWALVHAGMFLSGCLSDTHTFVPGPDGKFGYGGKCFPKDVNAFAKMTEGTPLGTLLSPLHELNVGFRGYEERI